MAKTKLVTMVVKVQVPEWCTAHQARRETRTLLKEQCFYGVSDPNGLESIEDNFKVVAVISPKAAMSQARKRSKK